MDRCVKEQALEQTNERTNKLNVVCSDNYVGGLGAAVLANALQKNTALQELYIKGNELGNEGVKALCSALTQRQVPFRVLDVGNNRSAGHHRTMIHNNGISINK